MNIIYPRTLNQRLVSDDDLDIMFLELKNGINTDKFSQNNVEPGAINYRTLKVPPKISLARRFGYPGALTFSAAFGGFYAVEESVLLHDSSHASASDRDQADRPVVQVTARLYFNDVGSDATYLHALSACRIGVSQDGGATWVSLSNTGRPVGPTCGYARRMYDTVFQRHYMDDTPGYLPFNANFDRGIQLVASFGGAVENVSIANKNAYCIMIDDITNFDHGYFFGYFWLNARERGY